VYGRKRGISPCKVLLAGRTPNESDRADNGTVDIFRFAHDEMLRLVHDADITPLLARIDDDTEIIVLNQLLEACPRASDVVGELARHLPEKAMLVVVFSNVASLPGRLLRRHWRPFFDWKSVYFDSENLRGLMERSGLRFVSQTGLSTSYTVSRVLDQAAPRTSTAVMVRRLGIGGTAARVPTGTYVSVFERSESSGSSESLSVIMPVFNEKEYVRSVLEQLLAKRFVIPHEVIVVESNSSDGTREIVRSFDGRPGLRIIYEDGPRGKGAAVRRGLTAAAGSIVLIQDADFEYDLDDYDALLEPIVQRRASFVLGSRSLGLDDWKVRRFAASRIKAFLMNAAQLVFALTFNVLYQQRITDVNTMFKVFRRECLEGIDFRGNGFNFDIELACMLVKNGYAPMEIPVNYVSRGFDEGKKVNFVSEFFPSYSMFYRCRFGRTSRR
jgi:Glycosyl transferase family 2